MRWLVRPQPVLPFGVPHVIRASQSAQYDGLPGRPSSVTLAELWFQLSLKSLFLLILLVATFFAGYSLRAKQEAAERQRAEAEARRAIEAQLESERVQIRRENELLQAEIESVRVEAERAAMRAFPGSTAPPPM